MFIVIGIVFAELNLNAAVDGWDYQYKINDKGMRNEAISGSLLYHGKPIARELGHVITPIGEFSFIALNGYGGSQIGWTPEIVSEDGHSKWAVTESDVEQFLSNTGSLSRRFVKIRSANSGGYKCCEVGKFDDPPSDIGANWFYMVSDGLWGNPDKMDELLKTLKVGGNSPR